MSDRRAARLIAVVLAAAVLAGCGAAPGDPVPTPTGADLSTYDPADHGNGVALLSPAAARDAALSAMRAAAGSEVSGAYVEAGSGRRLEIRRTGDDQTWTAELILDGAPTSVVVADADAWVRPSPAVAGLLGLPAGEWACVSPDDAAVERWMPLVQPVDLVEDVTADASGLSAPGEGTVDLLLGEEGAAGVLTIATTGMPLPSRLVRADETGTIDVTFSWGVEPVAEPPTAC